jgi:hypothetical protein
VIASWKYCRVREAIATRLLAKADQFKKEKGYVPPYWELVRLAREAGSVIKFR